MNHLPRFFAALLLGACTLTAGAAEPISARDAWVRAAPPGVTVLAGYLTLENHGATPRALLGVSSPQFQSVEMHRTEVKDGVASMSAQTRLEIPAHGTLHFAPNGYHLMLMDLRQPLQPGGQVELRLRFDAGAPLLVHAPVRVDEQPADDMPHEHHHH